MNGLLICSGSSNTKNIGDYIQTVAQEQFWENVDCFIEREALNSIESNERINVIMNGWFMWKPHNFPPADCINPLFVSFHVNPKCAQEFFCEKTIEYLKKYEPIGARDRGTQALLEKHGIKSYYSSCLTLTLGLKYKSNEKNGKIVFVDPYVYRIETPSLIIKSIFKAFIDLLKYPIKSHRLAKLIDWTPTRISNYSRWLDCHMYMASFYDIYSKVFADELLFNAVYVSHTIKNIGVSDEDKMQQARNLIRFYAGAKLVITSRIHAALPCLGIETPVIFIPSCGLDLTRENAGRFEGLECFFNIIRWKGGRLIIESKLIKDQIQKGERINSSINITNPDDFVYYRDTLIDTVKGFCNRCEIINAKDN